MVFLNTNEGFFRLTADEIVGELSKNSFIVVVPHKIVPKKIGVIWKVDKFLFKKYEDELVLELNRCNQWLTVSKVSKFTNGYHMNIECDEVRMTI